MKKYLALTAAALLMLTGTAHAEVMAFSGLTGTSTQAGGYTENGITADNTAHFFWAYDAGQTLHFDRGSSNGFYDFTFAGGAFDLISFDLLGNSAGSTATITGFDSIGATLKTGAFTLSNSTAQFSDWTGLSRVRVTATGSHFSIDNFNIAAATGAVPEPATWAMMILGMGAVGYAMRRRIKVSEVNFTNHVRVIAAS